MDADIAYAVKLPIAEAVTVSDRPLVGLVEENLSANVCRLNTLQYHYLVVKYEQYKTN